jgi:hypothetical protein
MGSHHDESCAEHLEQTIDEKEEEMVAGLALSF